MSTIGYVAFKILNRWYRDKGYINKLLSSDKLMNGLDENDFSYCRNLCKIVVERKIELDFIISKLSKVPFDKLNDDVIIILEIGISQLKYMYRVDFAICNEMVSVIKKTKSKHLSGFVNAILRTYIRKKDEIENMYPDESKNFLQFLSIQYSMPIWICEHFLNELGKEKTVEILKYFLKNSKITARCVKSRIKCESLYKILSENGIKFEKSEYLDYVFTIKNTNNITKFSMLKEGLIQIQDLSSILVAEVANPKYTDNILDICAAPGGKALHIADLMKCRTKDTNKKGCIFARDIHQFGVNLIKDRIKASKFDNILAVQKDALIFDENDVNKYDIVIADLPCSGLGVIGRKPDIKYYLKKSDIKNLATIQYNILKNAVQYVKKGGFLIYSTCTISFLENIDVTNKIVKEFGLKMVSIEKNLPKSISKYLVDDFRIQIIPGVFDSDGFFIAKMSRV